MRRPDESSARLGKNIRENHSSGRFVPKCGLTQPIFLSFFLFLVSTVLLWLLLLLSQMGNFSDLAHVSCTGIRAQILVLIVVEGF